MLFEKIFVCGFPKSGTMSLQKAFTESGINSAHWHIDSGYVGQLMYDGHNKFDDPWHFLESYKAITQADVCLPHIDINFWPNLDFDIIKKLENLYPDCLFLLNYRKPEDIINSIKNWGNLYARINQADIIGLTSGHRTEEDLLRWMENHFTNLREYFKNKHNFLELDISNSKANAILGRKLGIEIKWWGVTNKSNPSLLEPIKPSSFMQKDTIWQASKHNAKLRGKFLYYGNLGTHERQYKNENFIGLALSALHDREISHNAYDKIPVPDSSVEKIQSQDVFERLDVKAIPNILNDIYQVLVPNGIFRLSLPDYRSPLLRKRSIYDEFGNPIGDLMMGAKVKYDHKSSGRQVLFTEDGNSHLWFPTYESVLELIVKSDIRKCQKIKFYHYFANDREWTVESFPENEMHVCRAPPYDMRANGMPISIIVDFIK